MAERKQFLGVKEADPKLVELLRAARGTEVSEEELHEQRISFAFGNAPDSKFITKETVRASSRSIRLAGA